MGREILLVLTCLLMVGGWAAADDYYMLVREWPGTICLNTTCKYMENFNGYQLIHIQLYPQPAWAVVSGRAVQELLASTKLLKY